MQCFLESCKHRITLYRLRIRVAMLIRSLIKTASTTTDPIPMRELQALRSLSVSLREINTRPSVRKGGQHE